MVVHTGAIVKTQDDTRPLQQVLPCTTELDTHALCAQKFVLDAIRFMDNSE